MLQPDPQRLGLWNNPAWTPGTPGTFALIAGVSSYAHLGGGPQCFGMSSLFVSALTAGRFFDWISNHYSMAGRPLATCRLLLAPTAAERALGGLLAGPLLEPTFNNLDEAIGEWFADMAALPQAAAAQSRSLFFFSGHGLEIMEDRQILLPSDYLRPPTRTLDRAISTQNIARGLKGLAVPLHFLFLDACRNDHNNLGNAAPLEGTRILNEPANRAVNQDAFVPIFYGSAAGSQAFQPDDAARGPSLFGDALIEGLEAKGLLPDCSTGTCRIVLNLLLPFVDRRVRDIARTRFGEETSQRVRVRGDQTAEPVTEVPPPAPPTPPPPPAATPVYRGVEYPPLPAPAMAPVRMHAVRPTTSTFGDLHEIFGSENVTHIWHETARVRELGSPGCLVRGSELEIDRVERTQSTSSFRLDLRIPSAVAGRTYWLELQDHAQTFGCVLPTDTSDNPSFHFEMDFRFDPRTFQRLDVTLSENNPGDLGCAASLWRMYDEIGADAAIRQFIDAIPGRDGWSPLSAAIAGAVLLRTQSWGLLLEWLGNLARLAPQLPDCGVLWTEQLLRDPWLRDEGLALTSFLRLAATPLPFFAESLGYALRQAENFLGSGILTPVQTHQVQPIHQRLQNAVAKLRPGGLFATFYGAQSEITPRLIEL